MNNTVEVLQIVLAICHYESGNRPHVINYSDPTPAYGLCQLREVAARDVGFKWPMHQLLNRDLNLLTATKYFVKQLNRYKGNVIMGLKAYNAGHANDGLSNEYVDRVRRTYVKLYKKKARF